MVDIKHSTHSRCTCRFGDRKEHSQAHHPNNPPANTSFERMRRRRPLPGAVHDRSPISYVSDYSAYELIPLGTPLPCSRTQKSKHIRLLERALHLRSYRQSMRMLLYNYNCRLTGIRVCKEGVCRSEGNIDARERSYWEVHS